MKMFLVTLAAFGLFIAAMAIGVMFGRRPIQGSCGGLGRATGEDCDFCGKKDTEECQRRRRGEPD